MAENEGASPICRGKNLSWETIMLFFNHMPKEPMPKNRFNSYIEQSINGWTQTHSQIARQLAFYYEQDGICYPRFGVKSTLVDLFDYLVHWAHNYFIPNPYTPSLKGKIPQSIYLHLADCIKNGNNDFDSALDSLFDIPLSSHDKVRVYLQNYTNIKFDSGKIRLNDSLLDKVHIKSPTSLVATDAVQYYLFFDNRDTHSNLNEKRPFNAPLQQIFYGAPGTGKSSKVKETTEAMHKENVFRITFHPDSDYSTFVGCYKPTTVKEEMNITKQAILDYDTLVDRYKELLAVPASNVNQASTLMGYKYHDSIVQMQNNGHTIPQLVKDAYKDNTTYDTVVRNGMACFEVNPPVVGQSNQITYEFVPQSFIKAYVKAMQTPDENVMLVIEEINRGNCAQIFGDMFQLLDRNEDGVSDYAVKPDTDLENYLKEVLGDKYDENEGMRLPSNLYIWATMNTSDQSLFPIDSAFKRRWEWRYVPIRNKAEENYQIVLDSGKEYDWWKFLTKMNAIIADDPSMGEDKQMGYFFIKAKDSKITADRFVNKVLFYIFNDVFKDYLPGHKAFEGLRFTKFFKDGEVDEGVLTGFLDALLAEDEAAKE